MNKFLRSVKEVWYIKKVPVFYISLELNHKKKEAVKTFSNVIKSFKKEKKPIYNNNACFFSSNDNSNKGFYSSALTNDMILNEEKYFNNLERSIPLERIKSILNGEEYIANLKKMFGENYEKSITEYIIKKEELSNSENNNSNSSDCSYSAPNDQSFLSTNNYKPFTDLESSVNNFKIDYKNLHTYKYFINYGQFINMLCSSKTSNTNDDLLLQEKVNTYIECLCKMYIGHNLHYKIEEKTSKKTNLFILKGDYYFSLGYFTLSKINNPCLIKYYSKISERLSKNSFVDNSSANVKESEQMLVSKLSKKFISFIYFGCLGIKEFYDLSKIKKIELIEFSIKYGFLVFLREDISKIKLKNFQYLCSIEDFFSKSIELLFPQLPNTKIFGTIFTLIKDYSNKEYTNFSASLVSDLFNLIESMQQDDNNSNNDLNKNKLSGNEEAQDSNLNNKKDFSQIKEFLKNIHLEIEYYSKISDKDYNTNI